MYGRRDVRMIDVVDNSNFDFDDVKYVGYVNGRLILKACYMIGKDYIEEEMFIHEGELKFRYVDSKLKRYWENEKISDLDYTMYSKHIVKDVNRWCRNLGLQEVPEEA